MRKRKITNLYACSNDLSRVSQGTDTTRRIVDDKVVPRLVTTCMTGTYIHSAMLAPLSLLRNGEKTQLLQEKKKKKSKPRIFYCSSSFFYLIFFFFCFFV